MTSSSTGSPASPSAASAGKVRRAVAADRGRIADILRSTPDAFTAEEVDVALELVDEAVEEPDEDYVVRVLELPGGVLSGYTCHGRAPFTDGTWDLYWIAVHKDHHGDGSARRLMAAAEEDVRARGGKILLVETASKPSYARTRAFYEKIGYAIVSRIPDFYRQGDDKITYWKRF